MSLLMYNGFWFVGFVRFFAPSGSILGNVIKARGTRPAVEVRANNCLFNDNRVEASVRAAAVVLAGQVAVVSANRVVGGGPSIDVNTTLSGTRAAMLGNITSSNVSANPPLTAAFAALNLTG